MLDDLRLIHEKDPQDALGVAQKEPEQLTYEFKDIPGVWPTQELTNIIMAGMGGSALASLVSSSWPGFDIPHEIVRDYDIPSYVNQNTLFIASSYSGNTEETLSALGEAKIKGCAIVVIASGGKLAELARESGYPLLLLPPGLQPRYAVYFNLKAILTITDHLGITLNKAAELSGAQTHLDSSTSNWLPTVPTDKNLAKQIALECAGKSIVIYSGPKFFPAAYKWKIGFNENAKQIAWCNQYSEFNHNEFVGWTKQPVDKPYTVIDIRSRIDHPQIQKRMIISAKLLSGIRPDPIVVEAVGDNLIEQLLWCITLGDFVSIYTAILSGVNPTPVELIERLKKELA